eukprot:403375204
MKKHGDVSKSQEANAIKLQNTQTNKTQQNHRGNNNKVAAMMESNDNIHAPLGIAPITSNHHEKYNTSANVTQMTNQQDSTVLKQKKTYTSEEEKINKRGGKDKSQVPPLSTKNGPSGSGIMTPNANKYPGKNQSQNNSQIPREKTIGQSNLDKPVEKTTAYGKQKFVKKIIVDMDNGEVRSLEEALQLAEEGTIIKLCEGVYTCNVKITKPGIKIEPRDKDKPVYLLGNDGPVIRVDLKEKEHFVVIKKILLAHSGINIVAKFNQVQAQSQLSEETMARKANVKYLSEYDIQKDMNTVIMVQRVALPNSRVNIVNCEFMGNDNNLTSGCLFINADTVMSSCRFTNFKAGAIHSVAEVGQQVVIQDCEITKGGNVGIYCQGNDAKQYILRTKIDYIDGIGIRVHRGNRAKIKGCTIVKCQIGIEVLSADPLILMNNIRQNFENGIVTIAKNFVRCDGTIKYNTIEKNKDNGIICAGKENFTRIEKNQSIASNRRSGIKAIEGAQISIVKNKINSNFAQGILLVEGTSAHIEGNEIFTNFKANIAFGGDNSSDTVIYNNQIYSSRSEGIFVIESGYSWIKNNQIYDNNDGIIMFDSSPHLTENNIYENQRAGVIISGSSFPRVEKNSVFGNSTSGIIIRDNSTALVQNNKIFSNYYQVSTRQMKQDKINLIVEDNEIEGQNEFTNNCIIF